MWLLLIGGAAAATAWAVGAGKRHQTDSPQIDDTDDTEVTMGRGWEDVSSLVSESLGWPYWWSKGSPSTPWEDGANGVDCSGYAQMFLVELGVLSATEPDRGAAALADICDPVAIGDQMPGDLALYNGAGHVMIVAGPPNDTDGHSPVAGASSGGRTDLGNNPDARVKLFTTALYWDAFQCYMRLK